jgi:hypothetical protein
LTVSSLLLAQRWRQYGALPVISQRPLRDFYLGGTCSRPIDGYTCPAWMHLSRIAGGDRNSTFDEEFPGIDIEARIFTNFNIAPSGASTPTPVAPLGAAANDIIQMSTIDIRNRDLE